MDYAFRDGDLILVDDIAALCEGFWKACLEVLALLECLIRELQKQG